MYTELKIICMAVKDMVTCGELIVKVASTLVPKLIPLLFQFSLILTARSSIMYVGDRTKGAQLIITYTYLADNLQRLWL